MMGRALLALRTVQHLRAGQFAGRARRVWRQRFGPPRLRTPGREVSLHPLLTPDSFSADHSPALEQARRLRDGHFEAVGHSMDVADLAWTGSVHSDLFTYHAHYFDEAPALARLWADGDAAAGERLTELWSSWLAATRDGTSIGWDPYPTSCRVPAWIEALAVSGGVLDAPTLKGALLESLWIQTDRLYRVREFDLAGNHLLKNHFALVWGAVALAPAPIPATAAVESLTAELESQLLADGFHEERTPSYHLMVLHDTCLTIQLLHATDTAGWRRLLALARDMREAVAGFIRPDGSIHPFGDSTPVPQASPTRIEHRFGSLLGPAEPPAAPWHLEHAGFAGIRRNGLDLVFDCGPFGALHQPGHGHCDGLSFTMAVGPESIIVDPGIAGYGGDPDRHWARGTAAHNTVQIDGREQTEIWSVFRAARRAIARGGSVSEGADGPVLEGALSPFHMPACTHRRRVVVSPDGRRVEIFDTLVGGAPGRVESRLHFAPHLSVAAASEHPHWVLEGGAHTVRVEVVGFDASSMDRAPVFTDWNERAMGPVLTGAVAGSGGPGEFGFAIEVEAAGG